MNIDYQETIRIEARLKSATKKLHQLAPQMGQAKQVRQYDSDMRKNLLARHVLPHLKAGESATAAETHARASDAYRSELEVLANNLAAAEGTIAQYDAEYASYEAARSLLSFAKETLNL